MDPRAIPEFKKKQFLASLTEDEFRDQVVRPVYLMEGMTQGKDLCGPDEEGKDLYLWASDPIRKRAMYAIQAKRGDLKMSAKAKSNVITAETQLRTALAATVFDGKSKQEYKPACVVLVASGTINQAAQRHIVHSIQDARLEFRDSDDLIPLIDKHMPEFWNGIDVQKIPYLRNLRGKLIERSKTIDVSCIGLEGSASAPIMDDTFAQLYLHRYHPKPKKHRGKVTTRLELEEIPAQVLVKRRERLVLITGEAGAGKTTTLNRIALMLADRALESPDPVPIPVCLEASRIAEGSASLAAIAGDEAMGLANGDASSFSIEDLTGGLVVLLIDGLDEIADATVRERALDRVSEFHQRYPACQIIVASRDYPYIGDLVEKHSLTRFQISPISFRQAEKMIMRLARGDSLPPDDAQEMLRRLENIHGLELNPLLVTVFVATSDYSRSDVPANITELFKKFTEMLLGRWNKSKGVGQLYHAPLKDFLLCQVAFHMHQSRSKEIGTAECMALIERELAERGHEAQLDTLFGELVHSGLLRVRDDSLSFTHHLLQEYFAGRGIPGEPFLRTIVTDPWWTKAVVFYFGEKPSDSAGLAALRDGMDLIIGGDLFQAAVTVGLATQACYLMRVGEKTESLRWVVDRLASIKNESIKEISRHLGGAETYAMAQYFLYGRDAVASSVVANVYQQIQDECTGDSVSADEHETRLFWCVAGLIESGDLGAAESIISSFRPDDLRLLLALHMGSYCVQKLRVTSDEKRRIAKRICAKLDPKIRPLKVKVIEEFQTMLLEYRQGQVAKVEDPENEPAE